MAVYHLFDNETATFAAPRPNKIVAPTIGNLNQPATYEGCSLTVTGTSGNVSATASILASNDGVNFASVGTITVASGATPQTGLLQLQETFAFYSAILTAITGTGAQATCLLSA